MTFTEIAIPQAQTATVGTPEWWLNTLSARLDASQNQMQTMEDYYCGNQPLAFASEKFTKAFGNLFSGFADNWTQIVVDAVEERLNVEGFRLGDDPTGDTAAWDMWQANQMDAQSQLAHTDALKLSRCYATVWFGGDYPEINVESARQVICALKPGSRRERSAALKKWLDDDGYLYANLYLPDRIYKFRSAKPPPASPTRYGTIQAGQAVRWQPRETTGEAWPLVNPLGIVPVVPLVNRPSLLGVGESELAQVIPIQDSVNKLVADMLIASEYAAYRQRWATGLDIPRDPVTNEPIEPFKHAVDRLWLANPPKDNTGHPAGEVKFGEFEATDLNNYVQAIEMLVQHIASQTRTPPHYFYLNGQFPSGETIKSAETGLVAKARRKMRHFGESWEEVIRLGFMVAGDNGKAEVTNSQTIWADPESRTESEHMDATVKLLALQVPLEALWERAGFTPQEIARFNQLRGTETPAEQMAQEPAQPTETISIRA